MRLRPKPDNWDSDTDGKWADQPGARVFSATRDDDVAMDDGADDGAETAPGKGRVPKSGARKPAARNSKKATIAASARPGRSSARGQAKAKVTQEAEDQMANEEEENHEEEEEDDEDEDEEEEAPVQRKTSSKTTRLTTPRSATTGRKVAGSSSSKQRASTAQSPKQKLGTLDHFRSKPPTQRAAAKGRRLLEQVSELLF